VNVGIQKRTNLEKGLSKRGAKSDDEGGNNLKILYYQSFIYPHPQE
jgi:hypothetical protein